MGTPKAEALPIKDAIIPDVWFSTLAWAKIQDLITSPHKKSNEITWYGDIEKTDVGDLYINDVFVPTQEVTRVSTSIEDFNVIVPEAVEAGLNPMKLKAWFHLHPNGMSTSPSSVDVEQTDEYLKTWSYILRGIINNEGEFQLDYFDKDAGLQYSNLRHFIDFSDVLDSEEFEKVIKERVTIKTPVSLAKKAGSTYNTYSYDYAQDSRGNQDTVYVGLLDTRAAHVDILDAFVEGDSTLVETATHVTTMSLAEAIENGRLKTTPSTWEAFKRKIAMTPEFFDVMFPSVSEQMNKRIKNDKTKRSSK